jgi:hypothetical protein
MTPTPRRSGVSEHAGMVQLGIKCGRLGAGLRVWEITSAALRNHFGLSTLSLGGDFSRGWWGTVEFDHPVGIAANVVRDRGLKMAIVKNPLLRVACAGAFAAAIIIAAAVAISAGAGAGSRTVADPSSSGGGGGCTQVNTNGSFSLQCGVGGPQGVGGYGGYGTGCRTPYGTYQNCEVQRH